MKQALFLEGMHGFGDNLHQRAIIRQLIGRYDIWLESSWVSVYHDFIERGLKVVSRKVSLRTQTKNAERERSLFSNVSPPKGAKRMRIWYPPNEVRKHRSVLGAMCASVGCNGKVADFRLSVPSSWDAKARFWIDSWRPNKPLLIYRPLTIRREWAGCHTRNPRADAYSELFKSIRDQFFVVSVADISAPAETLIGSVDADAICHAGELDVETLAALFARADLVFTAPGFGIILAQAVGTPVVGVFGGYESAYSYSIGARFNRCLFIEPDIKCDCFKHSCSCDRWIDVPKSRDQIKEFADGLAVSAEVHV